MRKMLGIFTIAAAAFFLFAVSASATPSHHHAGGNQCGHQNGQGDNGWQCQCNQGDHFGPGQGDQGGDQGGCQGGDQGGQCGDWGGYQNNWDGGNGGNCQCNQGDHFGPGQGDQGGDQGDCNGGGSTPPPDGNPPTTEGPTHTFLCYSTFEVNPAVYTFDVAWQLLTSASDHYFTPYAVEGNVPFGTNVGGYHLVCDAGLLAHTNGAPGTYADSDGQIFDQAWANAMASDHGSYDGMTLNVFPVVG